MNQLRKTLSFMTAAVFLTGVSSVAMAQDAGKAGAAKPDAAKADAVKADPNKVLATINGDKITSKDVDQISADLDPQFARLPDEQRRLAALAAIIDIKALAAKAEAEKLDATPEFKARMQFLKDRALHNDFFKQQVVDKITDADVRARYDKEMAAMPPQNEVRARHILVKTKEEAEAIIKQLDGGASFEDVAKAKSTDGSAAQGGDLGYFSAGQMVPEFEKAAMALDVGKYTKEPVQTQFGFHVIKLEDKRVQQPPAFDQVKDQVKSILIRERYVELVKKERADLKIQYTDPETEKAMKAATDAQEQ
ncbi:MULTISPECIES: peptidylprolyl isomerase [Phyllobacterium]|jgi:peptidyl-prolyl cis-trans isomerase C|uniref:peptidylprolyl isomerase n=2 Tax=Phyllobacteriaceae TaxID=69277 RepID=UPI001AD07D6D|nr:peptidylprolyl isomerase [Phyllobacterium sp.]MBQ9353643.1 peptidylprolyl isomerase [Phyllobacterium sp.]MBZ3693311.1 peptidylprolyl isomerase [Phyllobacterium calauticae]|eukprot:gene9411-11555_t